MQGESALRLFDEYRRTAEPGALDEAIALLEDVVAAPGADRGVARAYTVSLGHALWSRHERTRSRGDLDRAVLLIRQAVESAPDDDPMRPKYLMSLGILLRSQATAYGDLASLDEAINLGWQTLDAPSLGGSDRRDTRLSLLGSMMRTRFQLTGRQEHAHEAASVLRQAVESTPDDHPQRAELLTKLGDVLGGLFEQTDDLLHLDEAIVAKRSAALATSPADAALAERLSTLGQALHNHAAITLEQPSLVEAAAALERAVQLTPEDDPELPDRVFRLAVLLVQPIDAATATQPVLGLDKAIELLLPYTESKILDDQSRSVVLSLFASSHRLRFEHTRRNEDLSAAIAAARSAVALAPSPTCLHALSNALLSRFDVTGQLTDLDEVITVQRRAERASSPDDPSYAVLLRNLGTALHVRFDRGGQSRDLDEAITYVRKAVDCVGGQLPDRIEAARRCGDWAALRGDWVRAAEVTAAGVRLARQLVAPELHEAGREFWLSQTAGLACDATAFAIQNGEFEQALALAEQGRGVLLADAIDRQEAIALLRERAPKWAESFEELYRRIDNASALMPGLGEVPTELHVSDAAHVGVRRRRLLTEFNELVERFQELPALRRILRPVELPDLLAQAAAGPIVILNLSRHRSDALLVTGTGVQSIPLLLATFDAVHDQAWKLLTALAASETGWRTRDRTSQLDAQDQVMAVLDWLWHAVTWPVLDALGITGPPPTGRPLPRIWWVPTGVLGLLPVHAAQSSEHSALDWVLSSYTPTVRTLRYARRPAERPQRPGVLTVTMPETPGTTPLPNADHEARQIAERFPGTVNVTGERATHAELRERLPEFDWVHFACHGVSGEASPSAGRLLVNDHQEHPFTVADLVRLRLNSADLAFLSACDTAQPHTAFTDEAFHLASACQAAGYRHVIGTLWAVRDDVAAELVTHFYDQLDTATDFDPGVALHNAVLRLRAEYPNFPTLWASHVHSGPEPRRREAPAWTVPAAAGHSRPSPSTDDDPGELVFPIGHSMGLQHGPKGSFEREWQIRLGADIHSLSDDEYQVWTRARTNELYSMLGSFVIVEHMAQGRRLLDSLLERGLLYTVLDRPSARREFALRHRLVPTVGGRGNTTEEPVAFHLGEPSVEVPLRVYDFWCWSHLDPNMWVATNRQAEYYKTQPSPLHRPTEPDRLLGTIVERLHDILRANAAYLDRGLAR